MLGASAYSVSKAGLDMLTRNPRGRAGGHRTHRGRGGAGAGVDTEMQQFVRAQSAQVGRHGGSAPAFLNDGQLLDPAFPLG